MLQEPHLAATLALPRCSDVPRTTRPDQDSVSGKISSEEEKSQYGIVPAPAPESSDEMSNGLHFEGVICASCGREAGSPIYWGPAATASGSKG